MRGIGSFTLVDSETTTLQRNARSDINQEDALERQWLWRGKLQPVAELDGAGNLVARFVYGGGVNVPELIVTPTATYRLVKDHLGSVRFVTNVATGAVVQEIRYDAWGRVLVDTNPGLQPFGFAGGLYDGESGLVRFGARDYDADSGRWTAKDPIRFGGGMNLYGYAQGQPTQFVDPSGKVIELLSNQQRLEPAWPGIQPRVETWECCGPAVDYPFLYIHCWLCVDHVEGGEFCAELTGNGPMTWIEPAGESYLESRYPTQVCTMVPDVDRGCVETRLHQDVRAGNRGPFTPYNNCITYVSEVEADCRLQPNTSIIDDGAGHE